MTLQQFDVFLAHSDKDKPMVCKIYRKLQSRNIQPWLDSEEIQPGASFQNAIQQAISQVKTAAIFIGIEGLGQWQDLELKTFISQCVGRSIPIIPVLLPGVTEIPENLLFLMEFNHVDFKDIDDEQAFRRLEWGITQRKPIYELVAPALAFIQSSQAEPENKIDDLEVLRDLLSSANFKEADKQTQKIALSSNQGKYLTAPIVRQLPLELLSSID